MLKNTLLSLTLLSSSLAANAAIVVSESLVTGADMTGMQVTAMFGNGGSETLMWSAISSDDSVAYGEGYSGGVMGAGWSLTQQGFTIGGVNPDDGSVLGMWTLENMSVDSGIVGFEIDALFGNVAFDIDSDAEVTPYSDFGIAFVTDDSVTGVSASYSQQVNPLYDDLFGFLTVSMDSANPLAAGEMLEFVADTDLVKVPEPAGLAILMAGLVLGASRFRRAHK